MKNNNLTYHHPSEDKEMNSNKEQVSMIGKQLDQQDNLIPAGKGSRIKSIKSTFYKLVLPVVIISMAIGFFSFKVGDQNYFEIARFLKIFSQAYKDLNQDYVDEVEPAGLMRKGIDGMLKSLDPYTNYITESQIEEARLRQSGQMGDIGVELLEIDNKIIIKDVFENLGAATAKIKPGYEIVSVNNKPVLGRTIDDVMIALMGQPNTELQLGIKTTPSSNVETINVKRKEVSPKDVTYSEMINDSVGYVKLTQFTANCAKFVAGEIEKLKANEKMKFLVFDLRHNPGGLLNEAINMVNLFVPKGTPVVSTKGRLPEWDKKYDAMQEPLDKEIPLILLIDEKSASASEIVSGCMQDLDRGIVLGQRSYGKGLVQQTRDIGYNAKLKLTVAKYFLPSGRCIQAIDYYGQYTDEGAKEIPDSLCKAFVTQAGRPVRDGSGVAPDLLVEIPKPSSYTQGLIDQKMFFEFCNEYQLKHDSIPPAKDFQFTDADFNDFAEFLKNKKFDFESKTELALAALESSSKEEKIDQVILDQFNSMRKKINAKQANELEKNKEEIKKLLRYELIGRYYYQSGKTEATLHEDPFILSSIALFGNPTKMKKILSPPIKK